MIISNSKLKTWRHCHYAYFLKYHKKIVKKKKAAALQRGTMIHSCLEAYNSGKSWKKVLNRFAAEFYKNTFEEERIEMGDLPVIVNELMENYTLHFEDDGYDFINNELYFQLHLIDGISIEGYIDAVVKDEKRRIWAKEYKTYKNIPDRDFLLFNNQSAIYMWALNELGYKPEGMVWDIIKAKQPSKPKLTEKTGKLSLSKLDSTPHTVTKGIRELGLNPLDYQEFINKHSFDDFFYRHIIRLNKSVVKSIIKDTQDAAIDMLEKGGKLIDRNLGRDCNWCQYKSICQASLMGLDVDFIIESEFEERKNEEKEKNRR